MHIDMKFWKKLNSEQRLERVQRALKQNVDFSKDANLGYPASKLDEKVFANESLFLREMPVLNTYIANPNHIGCHTFGTSEFAFKGTQELEREVLNMIAVDLFKIEEGSFDGYISPGGTEANIQALWIYRNEFIQKYGAKIDEIAILASEDTHYSIPKAGNLLMLDWVKVPVQAETRDMSKADLEREVRDAISKGKKYFIAIANMGTTMFGSVDDPVPMADVLKEFQVPFRLHIDGAYGGFVYPFSEGENQITFQNSDISSLTIDAHKMLQAPYGTGIFVCRKGLIENVLTKEAQYVEGLDLTLCGSRSGANAVAVWTILTTYGPHKWFEKISVLKMRTNWLCRHLNELGVPFFREPEMNIVTLRAEAVPDSIAHKYNLVPQSHSEDNEWYKIVLMDHVEIEHLKDFIQDMKSSQKLPETKHD
ncbi:Pyridoxal-dependent decarboxylase conserved domain-containing protein [Algoriphagus ornithinivorans]|uniref:Pyridoxal-dependent decarboxylase conserved domain-containing protein n=1 Tax=Algoriphagus ornithinivorans TaxID=226506 RepID=A0A1I5J418_9BACT|nr:pyridoxal-dependent decarboxylase [Algoriphagus ornithinivorans]SFO67497.1 Pyridoxal-dependent decarboxylase conserved domain-containing protein [Algoriphagus ornithinivorans]